MHTEEQIAITPIEGSSTITLRKHQQKERLSVRISTKDYYIAAVVDPSDFLIAARTLCEPPAELPFTAVMRRVLDEVAAERARQHKLILANRIPYDCASPSVLCTAKLPVLMEELGEVAVEMNNILDPHLNDLARNEAWRDLRKELIQVAAVAVAWAESLTTPQAQP